MILRLEGLTKSYDDKKLAVNNLNIELTNGIYGLLGANGAGKTTLIRMLVGLLKPTNGRILLNGEDISLLDDKYRDILGYLPQQLLMYENYTITQILKYIAALKGLNKHIVNDKIAEVLEIVGLTGSENIKIKKLSGGMKQRVGIAQVLLNDPRIIILDEPTSGIDPNERIKFRNFISSLSGERIILLSTHIVPDLEGMADNIIMMKKGEVIFNKAQSDILLETNGKVWEVTCEENQVRQLQKQYLVSRISRNKDVILRLITDKPPEKATRVNPTLEDSYIYFNGEVI